jgi:hypothetical protein
VTVESATRLDVTSVYSSRDTEAAAPCRGGGYGCGEHSCDKRDECCGGHGCAGAPALSTTLEVEQIREHVIEPRKPPLEMCADLNVTAIGRPRVDCPKGAGSCVTRVDYSISNIGNAASGPFEAEATLDPRQSVRVADMLANLLPGQSRTVNVTTPPGGNCFDPDCTVTVTVDTSNRVAECREDNNKKQETTQG